MSAKESESTKTTKSFDSAYSFSFAIGIGLVLFLAGLVISLTLGEGTTIGLIFGIPLLIAGLLLPLIMMRDLFKPNEVTGVCPHCSTPIKTSTSTIRLECPGCNQLLVVKDTQLLPATGVVETSANP